MNPFETKGYIEKNGELVRIQAAAEPQAGVEPVGSPQCHFEPRPSTDEQRLNKTEKAFLRHLRRLNPPYLGIQNITLKLGDDCRYTPDLNHINENGRLVFIEIKGWMRDDALVKLKVAARTFPLFDFVLVRKTGTGWSITAVKP
jgi:hypothetical protein